MFVIRRREAEAIMFEGGLTVTVDAIAERAAWLRFESPEIPGSLVVAVLEAAPARLCVGVAAPESLKVSAGGSTTSVTVAPGEAPGPPGRVLLVNAVPGQRIEFDGLTLGVVPSGTAKPALLAVETPALGGQVELAIITVSKFDVTVGISAPPDLRVYRLEVWRQLLEANQAAAGWQPGDLAGLPKAAQPQDRAG